MEKHTPVYQVCRADAVMSLFAFDAAMDRMKAERQALRRHYVRIIGTLCAVLFVLCVLAAVGAAWLLWAHPLPR